MIFSFSFFPSSSSSFFVFVAVTAKGPSLFNFDFLEGEAGGVFFFFGDADPDRKKRIGDNDEKPPPITLRGDRPLFPPLFSGVAVIIPFSSHIFSKSSARILNVLVRVANALSGAANAATETTRCIKSSVESTAFSIDSQYTRVVSECKRACSFVDIACASA